jgi:hypothetical protein
MSGPEYSSLQERGAIRDGITTGLIGAAVVALFFLGVDLIRGAPGLTPSVLGQVFVLREPSAVTNQVNASAAILFTVVHLLVFVFYGLTLSALTRRGETSSIARYALVALVVAYVPFFLGVLAVAGETTRGLFPAWSVLTANLIAGAAMVYYLWSHRPAFRSAWRSVPLGAQAEATN